MSRSPNHDSRRGAPIDMLVLHYTGMESAAAALDRLCDPAAKVSAHWLVDEDGSVIALVDEGRRAWHAGLASWRGETDVNARSVGIEVVNPGHAFGYRPFPAPQLAALAALCHAVLVRHPIPPRNVVGHSDVAPRRKQDPGELFPWQPFAAQGIGLWPDASADGGTGGDDADPIALLARFGYEVEDPAATMRAFQRRFRPGRIDGRRDAQCRALAGGLLRAAGEPA